MLTRRPLALAMVLAVVVALPARLAVETDRSLDDPSLLLLTLGPEGLHRLVVPAAGGILALPRTRGPAGL